METFKSLHTQDKGERPQQQVLVSTEMCFVPLNTVTNCFLCAVVFYLPGPTGTGAAVSTTQLSRATRSVASTSAKSCTPFRAVRWHNLLSRDFRRALRCPPGDMSEVVVFLQRVIFNICFSDHVKKLKNLSLVGNTRYFDNEVDYAGSEGLVGLKVVNIRSLRLSRCSISLDFLHSVRPSPSVPMNTQIIPVSSLKALLLTAKSSPYMFVATLQVFGAYTGGRCRVAPNQEGSAIAALRDQRDIVMSLCRSSTNANKAKSGRHDNFEDSCALANQRHDGQPVLRDVVFIQIPG